mgnify:CR=1 FL=1
MNRQDAPELDQIVVNQLNGYLMEQLEKKPQSAQSKTAARSVRSRAALPGAYFSVSPLLTPMATIFAIIWVFFTVNRYFDEPVVVDGDGDILVSYFGTELLIAEQGAEHSEPERWLAGTENPGVVERRAIRYLEKARSLEMLDEQGLSMLACLHWRQGDKASCQKLMGDLPTYELQSTWMIQSLLRGELLEHGEWQFLQRKIDDETMEWIPFFIVQQAANLQGEKGLPESSAAAMHSQKQQLLVTQTMLNIGTWALFLLGVVSCVSLIRAYGLRPVLSTSHQHRLSALGAQSTKGHLPKLWLLSVGLIVFVTGDLSADFLYTNLWASTPEDVSPSGWWFRLFLYDLVFRVMGVTFLVWMLFGHVGFAWRTFFQPVPKLACWVLAAMSITWGLDLLIYAMPDTWFAIDPTQVLNPEEYGRMGLVYGIFSGVILAPICEEIVFRGLLFNILKNRLGLCAGVLISSVIFASVHYYGVQDLFAVFVFGAVMAWLYHKTNSLIPGILCHALYNLVITLWTWIIHQSGWGV